MRIVKSTQKRVSGRLREKAIARAETRILLAGRKPADFSPDELEIVVQEEEAKVKGELKEKGVLALLALLGLSWFG
ncbi:MAG: dihydrouridine synthase [Porticoccaceae bacterium]